MSATPATMAPPTSIPLCFTVFSVHPAMEDLSASGIRPCGPPRPRCPLLKAHESLHGVISEAQAGRTAGSLPLNIPPLVFLPYLVCPWYVVAVT